MCYNGSFIFGVGSGLSSSTLITVVVTKTEKSYTSDFMVMKSLIKSLAIVSKHELYISKYPMSI